MLPITCLECSLRIRRICPSMILYRMTCSTRSPNLTRGTQILLILWLQVMYYQGKTKGSSSTKVISTYGMYHTSSEFALMAYSEDVYRQRKASRLSNDATHHHMEDIMGHSVLIQRSSKADSFGQPCMKIRKILSRDVERVRGIGILIQEMLGHSPTTSRSSSLMFEESITLDLFQSQRTMNTSWWKLTMSPNGLKPCHRELLMQRTLKMFEETIFP